MMLSPPSAKKLSSMPTSASPSVSANSPHSTSSCGVRGSRRAAFGRHHRRRQRPPVELAVRRQRQPLQHHERRRHHVVRQQRRHMLPQRRRIQRQRRPSPPRTPPAAARRQRRRRLHPHRHRAARSRRPAPPPSCRCSAASISPGSMRKPRSFTCASARPRKSSTPSRAPARQVAGAVHPAARRPERIGHEPLRRQPGTPQIAPRQTRTRNVQLARNTRRNRLQRCVQNVGSIVWKWTTNRDDSNRICVRDENLIASIVVSVGP